jgi:hypothetical protein
MTEMPFRVVEYYPLHWGHGHQYYADDGETMEEIATNLANAVMDCNVDKHDGHGHGHSLKDAQDAFTAAQLQFIFEEDKTQWSELMVRIAHNKMWGGQAPALVLTPGEDPEKWLAIVKHPVTGEPTIYDARDDLGLPDPRELGFKPNSDGPGWTK